MFCSALKCILVASICFVRDQTSGVVPSKSTADMQNSCQHAQHVHTQRSNLLIVPIVATKPIRARAAVPAVDHANAQQPGVIDWQDVDQPLIWKVSGT